MSKHCDVFVIGAGIAGMTAAEQAARHGLSVVLAEESMFGGLVTNVNHLNPRPQHPATSGADLAGDLMNVVLDLGVETVMTAVQSLERLPSGQIEVATVDERYLARCAIIASGARLRKLDIPGETEFEHRGVSHCADCDGPFYRGQPVVVVGGGDSALQQAAVLANFSDAVHLIHRGDTFSARDEFVRAVKSNPRIAIHLGTAVDSIEGESDVGAVRLRNVTSGQPQLLPCKGIFAYIGLEPNAGLLGPDIEKHAGRISVNAELETSLANVYAIGAVRAGYGGELTDAMDDAVRAVKAVSARLARS